MEKLMNKPLSCCTALLVTACALIAMQPASALVLHPGDDPPNLLSTPLDAVVGRWGNNASAVAIAPNYVITTRHQDLPASGVGIHVVFGGTTYVVAQIIVEPSGADLRIARLETLGGDPANLTSYLGIYDQTDEVTQGVVLGGFGEGRGANIGGTGYVWSGVEGTQRWGANTIDNSFDNQKSGDYTNDILVADFDSDAIGVYAEATLAAGDSGGGWFINDGGVWKVAALNQGVEVEDENNPNQAIFTPAEELSGVRLSSYSSFINANIPEPTSGLAMLTAFALCAMRRRRA